jgi:hypothetical protein
MIKQNVFHIIVNLSKIFFTEFKACYIRCLLLLIFYEFLTFFFVPQIGTTDVYSK